MRRSIAFLFLWLCLATPAAADSRVALVIGNSAYVGAGPLVNPKGDAALIAETLRGEGFKVTPVHDATRDAMLKALRSFSDDADQADWAIVYYAGHGIEVGGINYLLPIDVVLREDRDAQDEGISLNRVLDAVARAHKLRVVILDACRNNPFAATMKRSIYSRAIVDRGLAPAEPPAGILVVYAAEAGQVAEDGASGHSPFTAALARRMQEPGLEVRRLFDFVTADVLDATDGHQRPYQYGSNPTRDAFYFTPPAPTAPSIPEGVITAIIDAATRPDQLTSLIASLPEGPQKERAKARAEALRPTQTASLTAQPSNPAATSPSAGGPHYILPEGATILPQIGHSAIVAAVAFSPDGRTIIYGSEDGTLKLWDAASGAQLRTLKGHDQAVSSVAFSPDGRVIVSGSEDRTLKLWDAANGALLRTLKGHNQAVRSVAFSPDGRIIGSGGDDKNLELWDAASGALLRTLKGHDDGISSVAFSRDGRIIVSGSDDKTLKLWDVASGGLLRTLEGLATAVFSVAFSPDGRFIVSGSFDGALKLWEAASGTPLRTLEGHSGSVYAVAFSPNGRFIVSGGWDSTVWLWDAAKGSPARTLKGHDAPVTSVAFSPDGRFIVSGSRDKTLKLWDAATGALIRTNFDFEGHGAAITPDGRFVTDGDPRAAFAIVRGSETLPMDEFIAADRRDTLAGETASSQPSKAPLNPLNQRR